MSNCTISSTEVEDFQHLFADLFFGTQYQNLDPHTCIHFTILLAISPSGVQRLICLLDKSTTQLKGVHYTDLAKGSGTPIVVGLEGILSSFVYNYLNDKGLDGNSPDAAVNHLHSCCDLMDSDDSNLTISWLAENNIEYKHYSWFVTVLSGGTYVAHYIQLA